ncbi:MAG: hypothetical protein HY063_04860 [Bacteroidetes bacterium]|nr:hypothetical protein [Bacteroidota bacterium]
MEYEYTNRYERDLLRYTDNEELIHIIAKKVLHITRIDSIDEMHETVVLRKKTSRYRIKIKLSQDEVYRIGIIVLKNTVWFTCIDKDKKRFYKRFK